MSLKWNIKKYKNSTASSWSTLSNLRMNYCSRTIKFKNFCIGKHLNTIDLLFVKGNYLSKRFVNWILRKFLLIFYFEKGLGEPEGYW